MKRFLTLFLVLYSYQSAFAEGGSRYQEVVPNCAIHSSVNPNLAIGINHDTLCTSVVETLKKYKNYDGRGLIRLMVLSQAVYSVSMSYSFFDGPTKIEGRGVEYWNPDQAEFVLDNASGDENSRSSQL